MVTLIAIGWSGASLESVHKFTLATPTVAGIQKVIDSWSVMGKNGVIVDGKGYRYAEWNTRSGYKSLKNVTTLVKGWEMYKR